MTNLTTKQLKEIRQNYESSTIEELRHEIQVLGEELNNPDWYWIDPNSGNRMLYTEDYGDEVEIIHIKLNVIKTIISERYNKQQQQEIEQKSKNEELLKKQKLLEASNEWHNAVTAYNLRKKQWYDFIEENKRKRDSDLLQLTKVANAKKQIFNNLKGK